MWYVINPRTLHRSLISRELWSRIEITVIPSPLNGGGMEQLYKVRTDRDEDGNGNEEKKEE